MQTVGRRRIHASISYDTPFAQIDLSCVDVPLNTRQTNKALKTIPLQAFPLIDNKVYRNLYLAMSLRYLKTGATFILFCSYSREGSLAIGDG